MKKKRVKGSQVRRCPRCYHEYNEFPALSRRDNATYICPACGGLEALEDIRFIVEMDDWTERCLNTAASLRVQRDRLADLLSRFVSLTAEGQKIRSADYKAAHDLLLEVFGTKQPWRKKS